MRWFRNLLTKIAIGAPRSVAPVPAGQVSDKRNLLIDPRGRIYQAEFAGHAQLLKQLGMSERQAEDAGWIRISLGWPMATKQPTEAQVGALLELGIAPQLLQVIEPVL